MESSLHPKLSLVRGGSKVFLKETHDPAIQLLSDHWIGCHARHAGEWQEFKVFSGTKQRIRELQRVAKIHIIIASSVNEHQRLLQITSISQQ